MSDKSPTTAKPSRAVITALEKVFEAEINGRLPFQSKAAIYRDLTAAGLVEPMQRSFGSGAMAVTVTGYALTIQGNYLYCANCAEENAD